MSDVLLYNALADAASSKKITAVTSDANTAPNVDITSDVVRITTSGSGGPELINVPNPTPDASGTGNPLTAGHRLMVELVALTDPGDSVQISLAGGYELTAVLYQSGLINSYTAENGIVLSAVGHAATFQIDYTYAHWFYAPDDVFDNTASQLGAANVNIYGADAYDGQNANGGNVGLHGGGSNHTGKSGGAIVLASGAANTGDANGGLVLISLGAGSGTGKGGNLVISNLPTADPHVANALWSDSGVLTVSAG